MDQDDEDDETMRIVNENHHELFAKERNRANFFFSLTYTFIIFIVVRTNPYVTVNIHKMMNRYLVNDVRA